MKQKTFVIRDDSIIDRLVDFLKAWPSSEPCEVAVREYKKDRSIQQNSLYWVWVTAIADHLGLTKEDVHFDLKYRMLCRIYERDDSGYSEMIRSIRKLRKIGLHNEHKTFVEQIVKLTSTASATAKQFAEYLTEIERDCINKNIILPHPEYLYQDAIG